MTGGNLTCMFVGGLGDLGYPEAEDQGGHMAGGPGPVGGALGLCVCDPPQASPLQVGPVLQGVPTVPLKGRCAGLHSPARSAASCGNRSEAALSSLTLSFFGP
jgi:hypothetical protein